MTTLHHSDLKLNHDLLTSVRICICFCLVGMWGLIFILLITSVTLLSIPQPGSDYKGAESGWQLVSEYGLIHFFRKYNPQVFAWWYAPNKNVSNFMVVTTINVNVLVCVVPILSVIFSFLTWRLLNFLRYPKAIEYLTAIKGLKTAKRKLRKLNRHLKHHPQASPAPQQNQVKTLAIAQTQFELYDGEHQNFIIRQKSNRQKKSKWRPWINRS